MAFESLSQKLTSAFKHIQGKSKLSEANMENMLKEVRLALLEADVNFRVVKQLIEEIKEEATGEKVLSALNPDQMVVKVVHDKLVSLLGDQEASLRLAGHGLSSIMMVGLQGGGKTTSTAKIAHLLKTKQNKKVLLVACDIIRPAAIEQLKTLGRQIDVEVFERGTDVAVLDIVKEAKNYALSNHFDIMIIDTAGRLHVDDVLMNELKSIKSIVKPEEILLVVDAMSGQDIIHVATSFHEALQVSGLVVTKMDGDSRGGSVLSVRKMTSVPVKFVGQGEKIDDLDIFYPERMADRILGMGDVMTLVEKAQANIDEEAAEKAMQKMLDGTFDLNDMLNQMRQIKKMGPLSGLMKLIPGMNQLSAAMPQMDDEKTESAMKQSEAIILSMTKKERKDPSILRSSSKRRIAQGSGTTVADVNRLLSQFNKSKEAMKIMANMGKSGKMPNVDFMQGNKKQAMSRGQVPNFMKGKR